MRSQRLPFGSFVQWTIALASHSSRVPLRHSSRLVLSPGIVTGNRGTKEELELHRYVTDYLTVDG